MKNGREHNHSNHTDQAGQPGSIMAALFVGGLVGAGAMMLLAPRSGKETRAQIEHKTLELRDQTVESIKGAMEQVSSRGRELADEVKEKAENLQEQSRETLAHQFDRIAGVAKAGKKAVRR